MSDADDKDFAVRAPYIQKILELQEEIIRLNAWANSFSDAQIKERQTGEMYQRELRREIVLLKDVMNRSADRLCAMVLCPGSIESTIRSSVIAELRATKEEDKKI